MANLPMPPLLANVTVPGAEVNNVCAATEPTVTEMTTWVPVASMTKTCAVPATCPPTIDKVVSLMPETATAVLLLLVR